MSQKGVKTVAAILSDMQQTRGVLLMGDNQDIRLGQLLETAKDAIKKDFARIAEEPTP